MKNSDINGEKTVAILKALLKQKIRILEFSNCKIGDKGAIAVAKFILEVPTSELVLSNNRIGMLHIISGVSLGIEIMNEKYFCSFYQFGF